MKLQEKRASLVAEARTILDRAETEARSLSADESAKYDQLVGEAEALGRDIARQDAIKAVETELRALVVPKTATTGAHQVAADNGVAEVRAAFDLWMRTGEVRALTTATNDTPKAGYLAPTDTWQNVVKILTDINVIRGIANVVSIDRDLKVPCETSVGTAGTTAEGTGPTASDVAFTEALVSLQKFDSMQPVTIEMLEDSIIDLAAYIVDRLAVRIGLAEEAYHVGVALAGSTEGVEAASATAITADEIIDMYHSVPLQYRQRSTWVVSDGFLKTISKLKENGIYLFTPGLSGQPDMIKGRPVVISASMAAPAADAKVAMFGDFSYLFIGQKNGLVLQRLVEKYHELGQVAFAGYVRSGSAVTNTAAIKHLKMAAGSVS